MRGKEEDLGCRCGMRECAHQMDTRPSEFSWDLSPGLAVSHMGP